MSQDILNPRMLVHNLSEKIRACYVLPGAAEAICACLQQHLEAGEYADIEEGELLGLALTLHLQEVSHDEHLWVRWHEVPLPEGEEALRQNAQWQEERMLEARLGNYGINRVERLPGNVGLLEIRYLHRPAWGGDTLAAAMNFIAHAQALIIDLRNCSGGYPGMVVLALSYLFGEEPVHLSSIYWRDDDFTQQYWSLSYVPGRRFLEKPVYVLTSKVTFSAGEAFASILQNRKRALVLGDQTDGGAHPGVSYRLNPHFEAFIPVGRGFDPLTGADIEGSGVTPDILVPQEQAFKAAYHMALRSVLASLVEPASESLWNLAKEAQAALKELEQGRKICLKCGYPTPPYLGKCKNCGEIFSSEA